MSPNREIWLERLIDRFRPHYEAVGVPIPERVRVSCGWPSRNALGAKSRRMGECWAVEAAEDAVPQIFISPLVSEGAKAAGILAHELIHASLPTGSGHKKPFITACKKVGVTDGPPKSAMPGPELREMIDGFLAEMEPYPHAALVPLSADKKQTTRMMKIVCRGEQAGDVHEEYVLRGSRKVIAMGLPICPVCEMEMVAEGGEGDEETKED